MKASERDREAARAVPLQCEWRTPSEFEESREAIAEAIAAARVAGVRAGVAYTLGPLDGLREYLLSEGCTWGDDAKRGALLALDKLKADLADPSLDAAKIAQECDL